MSFFESAQATEYMYPLPVREDYRPVRLMNRTNPQQGIHSHEELPTNDLPPLKIDCVEHGVINIIPCTDQAQQSTRFICTLSGSRTLYSEYPSNNHSMAFQADDRMLGTALLDCADWPKALRSAPQATNSRCRVQANRRSYKGLHGVLAGGWPPLTHCKQQWVSGVGLILNFNGRAAAREASRAGIPGSLLH